MEKDFVPSNLSLELKGLNFDKPCFGRYYYKESYPMLNPNSEETELVFEFGQYIKQTEITILAPTFSQAFRWFRKNYKIRFFIQSGMSDLGEFFKVIFPDGEQRTVCHEDHDEAELDCLKKLIEIVKNK
jgi:hypothetical protein